MTVKVATVAPVNALESFAVRIHSEPEIVAGTVVKANVRSPYWVSPGRSAGWIDQSAALAASLTAISVMSPAADAEADNATARPARTRVETARRRARLSSIGENLLRRGGPPAARNPAGESARW